MNSLLGWSFFIVALCLAGIMLLIKAIKNLKNMDEI